MKNKQKNRKPTPGSLLRSLRMRSNWTLKEMSERTGIPLSTLAKVEHDRLTLTYDKLQQVSQRLDLRMSELFAEPEDSDWPSCGRSSWRCRSSRSCGSHWFTTSSHLT